MQDAGSGKWRVTASRTVLKDRWIDVRADDCVTPAGADIKPYYVLGYPDWVHVVAITPARELVLVRQYRHAVAAFSLELPGGMIDAADASSEAAARRELREETGFHATAWQLVTSSWPNPATHTNRIFFHLARDAERVAEAALEPGEHGLAVTLMPIAEVLAGLQSGLIGQAMHVAGILLALSLAGLVRIEAG